MPIINETNETLFNFPCMFPLKIMGLTQDNFAPTVTQIIQQYAPDFDPATMEMRPSKTGKYLSLTCSIRATSKNQLDDLYRILSSHPLIKTVL